MKIFILGANGMAGHTIAIYFIEKGYQVTTFTMQSFDYGINKTGNALNKKDVLKALQSDSYDVVINCIGILNKDCDENTSQAVYLNSFLPHFLSDILKNTKTKLIHMSTDCVFAGNTGPYTENSLKDGISFYDRTKALGEVVNNKDLTFRNSIIGPDINQNGIGLFNWFMKQSGSINGFSQAIWTGVTTLTLAKAMEAAISDNLIGLYNLVNNQSISKYDLLLLFNKYFKDNEHDIKPDDSYKLDKTLISTRNDFSFTVPSYKEMIIEMKDWIYKHKALYSHYFG